MKITNKAFEISSWVNAVKLAALNKGEQDSGSLCTKLGMGAIPGLSSNHRVAKKPFLRVVINGELRVIYKSCQSLVIF